MDIFLYSYARPIYLQLTLNSLFYNTLQHNHNVHVVLNKSRENTEERRILQHFAKQNLVHTILFLDKNYLQHSLDILYNFVKTQKKISNVICLLEDDLICPPYFKEKHRDFLQKFENKIISGQAVLVGARLFRHNHYNDPDIFKQNYKKTNSDFVQQRIGGHYLTMQKSFYEEGTKHYQRVCSDIEFVRMALQNRKHSTFAFTDPILHLGWHRQMDYPDYYEELYNQRTMKHRKFLKSPPSAGLQTLLYYKDGKWSEQEIEMVYTWSKKDGIS